jgi:hypothetical protein
MPDSHFPVQEDLNMRALLTLATSLLVAAPAFAQSSQPGVPSPEAARAQGFSAPTTADVADLRTSQVIVYGDDPCPTPPTPEDIIVCVRFEEAERFRIPENLRSDPNAPENQSWTNKAIELSYVGRGGIGSCSPDGPGGFTGCNQQLINQAVAERRGRPEVNWARLIEQARQERLSGINTASAQAEAEAGGSRRLQQLRLQPGQLCPPSTESVIIACTYPDGTPAPTQPAGEPVIPIGGRVVPATTPQAAQPQAQPPR